MHVSHRSYLTAGLAVLSAGALSLAPVQPLSRASVATPELTKAAVHLAAAVDPITPWIDTFQTAALNIGGLVDTWALQPLPIIQQTIANWNTYFNELPDLSTIAGQVLGNVVNSIKAPYLADTSTLDNAHLLIYTALPEFVSVPQALLDFTTSPASGVLIGAIGPVLGPVIALSDSIRGIFTSLSNSDFAGALNTLINIPAAMVNAFLNGGPKINISGLLAPLLPAGSTLNSADIALGGLFSQGASLLNAVGVDAQVKVGQVGPVPILVPLAATGNPAGLFGAAIAWNNAIARAITVTPPAPAQAASRSAAAVAAADETAVAPEVKPALDDAPAAGKAATGNKQISPRASRQGGKAGSAAAAGNTTAAKGAARAAASRGH